MRICKICAAALTVLLLAMPASATDRAVTGGVVRGEDLPDGSTVFRGIPYAAPPVGELRWRPPKPVVPWSSVRDATKKPAPCIQHDEGWNTADAAAGQEDCLTISLHAPKHRRGKRLPVLVWIHGGSNRAGSGSGIADSPIYRRGIVVVGVQYRLGVFGFLGLAELAAESPRHSSGNYAILDQIAALRWIHDNIAAFGGDPGNVTIAGQSAGAGDVGLLMLSPLARGLFAQAVEESGVPGPPRSAAQNEKIGSDLLSLMQLPAGTAGLKALRDAPAPTVLAQSDKLKPANLPDGRDLWIETTPDGWVLPDKPNAIYASGLQAPVPLLIGNNTREFNLDGPPDIARGIIANFFGKNSDSALSLYGFQGAQTPQDDPFLGGANTQVITDLIFRCPSNWVAQWQVAAGQKVWRYQFGVAEPGSDKPVAHNAELKYVFDEKPTGVTFGTWPPVQDYWANFMKTGNPNGSGLPRWPDMGKGATYIAFTPNGPELGKDLRGPICRLLADSLR